MGKDSSVVWPMPKFRFEVNLGSGLENIGFQEVSGLDVESQVIEHNNNYQSSVQAPGLGKYGNVVMKKGVFENNDSFWNWHGEILTNTTRRRSITITLLDEGGSATMHWKLENAWATKITSPDLRSDDNEIAVESIEITHENLTVKNGKMREV